MQVLLFLIYPNKFRGLLDGPEGVSREGGKNERLVKFNHAMAGKDRSVSIRLFPKIAIVPGQIDGSCCVD